MCARVCVSVCGVCEEEERVVKENTTVYRKREKVRS